LLIRQLITNIWSAVLAFFVKPICDLCIILWKNLIYMYLIHTVKTGVSLSTQVKLKFLFSIRQADLLNIVLVMEMKLLNVYQIDVFSHIMIQNRYCQKMGFLFCIL
jgi:phosphoglycerol transferase MdoB-like AlkP superfamily enzyme